VLVRATCTIFKWIYLINDVRMSSQISRKMSGYFIRHVISGHKAFTMANLNELPQSKIDVLA